MTEQQIKQIEQDYNVTILYITKSGSHLYGTNDENSDTDYKGIFVPSKQDVLLKQDRDYIKLDSNKSNKANTSDDIYIHLDSIYKWLNLVAKGETGAIDTLFSMWIDQSVYHIEYFTNTIKNNYLKLVTKKPQAFVDYCVSQARKYNVKGERYNELTKFLYLLKTYQRDQKLLDYYE